MYIAGFVIPVPLERMEAYREWAQRSAELFKELGCMEVVEAWEDQVPDGRQTDFRRAVMAKPGEKIVFSWQVWPDRASVERAEAAMQADSRFAMSEDIPFDAQRLILGCFKPLHVMGRA